MSLARDSPGTRRGEHISNHLCINHHSETAPAHCCPWAAIAARTLLSVKGEDAINGSEIRCEVSSDRLSLKKSCARGSFEFERWISVWIMRHESYFNKANGLCRDLYKICGSPWGRWKPGQMHKWTKYANRRDALLDFRTRCTLGLLDFGTFELLDFWILGFSDFSTLGLFEKDLLSRNELYC